MCFNEGSIMRKLETTKESLPLSCLLSLWSTYKRSPISSFRLAVGGRCLCRCGSIRLEGGLAVFGAGHVLTRIIVRALAVGCRGASSSCTLIHVSRNGGHGTLDSS